MKTLFNSLFMICRQFVCFNYFVLTNNLFAGKTYANCTSPMTLFVVREDDVEPPLEPVDRDTLICNALEREIGKTYKNPFKPKEKKVAPKRKCMFLVLFIFSFNGF
jgi:hypothetical protein